MSHCHLRWNKNPSQPIILIIFFWKFVRFGELDIIELSELSIIKFVYADIFHFAQFCSKLLHIWYYSISYYLCIIHFILYRWRVNVIHWLFCIRNIGLLDVKKLHCCLTNSSLVTSWNLKAKKKLNNIFENPILLKIMNNTNT